MIIISNNTVVHIALYILQLVNLNYQKLMSEDLMYIFNILLTITFSNIRHIYFLTFISLFLRCVSTSEEKFSKHDSPPTLKNFLIFLSSPSSPTFFSSPPYVVLKNYLVSYLLNFILDCLLLDLKVYRCQYR